MDEEFAPFMRHALADEFAKQVASQLIDTERDALLLWKAYVKRMRPVPEAVLKAAVAAYRNGEEAVGVQIMDADDAGLVMDKVGDLAWHALDDAGRREWMLKVV